MELSLKDNIQDQEKIQMLFALGKAYESKANYKKSFEFYEKGNWMQRKIVEYNAQENSNNIDTIIDFFKKNKKNIDFKSGYKAKDPIFILGLPRAGSTLLEQILSSHSSIEGTQELHNIMTIGRRIKSKNDSLDPAPKSPIFTPVSTISFVSVCAIFSAIFMVFSIVPLLLIPLALGIVQKVQ